MAKVMTWNVWDIPVSQFRETRMEGIAKVLRENKDNIDLVGLMECWLEKDRNKLIEAGKTGGLVYSVFFRNGSGFPGGQSSGLVLLSRWPIVNSFYHRFSAAGKPQKILHWDFNAYSGKGIGWAQIKGPGCVGDIDFYISHFVAYYTPHPEDPKYDEYVYQRHLAAWEAAQFIKSTARDHSFAVYCVDLNADPESLTYKILTQLGGLGDAWSVSGRARRDAELNDISECNGLTVNYPGSCYHDNNAWIASGEPSSRVDYILFSSTRHMIAEWVERRFSGPELIEVDSGITKGVSLSDHSAVLASFVVAPFVSEGSEQKEGNTNDIPGRKGTSEDEDKLTQALLVSTKGGIADALRRRRIAIFKAWLFCAIAIFVFCISLFLERLVAYSDCNIAVLCGSWLFIVRVYLLSHC